MSFEEEIRHQTRNDAPSSRASRNDGREHDTSASSISHSRSHDVHSAERPSPSTLRHALAAGQRRSLSQPKSLNQAVDFMGSDLAPAASEQESANSNPVGSFYGMGRSRYASKQPFNDNLSSLSSQTCSQSTVEPQRGMLLKLSTITSRDSLGDPPEVFENPESSSPGRSVRSLRSMHSVSPPGRGPIFPSEFDYLTKKPSKQSSLDADPIKITVSTPKGRSQTSISNELDQGQSSRDHAPRVNINVEDIESKQSWKSSSPPGEYLQKHNPFVIYCTYSHHHLPHRFCPQHGRL